MKEGLIEKFSQNVNLKEELLRTFDAIIVEASPYDKIWELVLTKQMQNKIVER